MWDKGVDKYVHHISHHFLCLPLAIQVLISPTVVEGMPWKDSYKQTYDIKPTKFQKLKCFSSSLAVVFARPPEALSKSNGSVEQINPYVANNLKECI